MPELDSPSTVLKQLVLAGFPHMLWEASGEHLFSRVSGERWGGATSYLNQSGRWPASQMAIFVWS